MQPEDWHWLKMSQGSMIVKASDPLDPIACTKWILWSLSENQRCWLCVLKPHHYRGHADNIHLSMCWTWKMHNSCWISFWVLRLAVALQNLLTLKRWWQSFLPQLKAWIKEVAFGESKTKSLCVLFERKHRRFPVFNNLSQGLRLKWVDVSIFFSVPSFYPYAQNLKLKWSMSAAEDWGRLGVAVQQVFHFDENQRERRRKRSIFDSCSWVCVMRSELTSWLSVRTLGVHTCMHIHTQQQAVGTPSWRHDQTQELYSHVASVLLRRNITFFEWWHAACCLCSLTFNSMFPAWLLQPRREQSLPSPAIVVKVARVIIWPRRLLIFLTEPWLSSLAVVMGYDVRSAHMQCAQVK